MFNKRTNKHHLLGFAAIALSASSSTLLADSAKLLNELNGHYYQSFDLSKTWSDAKAQCELLGAHLATITGEKENNFILTKLHRSIDSFWIGGKKEPGTSWTWITGEPYKYSYWYTGQSVNTGSIYIDWEGFWRVASSGTMDYVCEWEPKTYIDVVSLPDVNGNGSSETAALYIDTDNFSHKVVIKDNKSQETLNTLTFDTDNRVAPLALTQVSDMDGNGAPEIAVMYWTKRSGTSLPMVGLMLKDAVTGDASRRAPITLLSLQYKAISLTSTADITNDGVDELEILVMKYSDSTISSQIIDPVKGTVVKIVNF